MSILQKLALLVLCFTAGGNCFAQYLVEPIEVVQTIETLPWSEVVINDFNHNGEGELIEHIRNHPMLGDELEKLHEWLHQKVERLRPNGARSFIAVEATKAEFTGWLNRGELEKAGWRIVHVPSLIAQRTRTIVAIDRMHFSKQGFVTNSDLNRYNTQYRNRQFQPLKNAGARWVTKITMHTRSNCSWCDKWKATEYSQALADGVAVEFVVDANGTVPRFDVCDDKGQCRQYVGFKAYQEMKRDFQ